MEPAAFGIDDARLPTAAAAAAAAAACIGRRSSQTAK